MQKNGNMSLKYCIIIELQSAKAFFSIVLYTNMAAVTSRENRELTLPETVVPRLWLKTPSVCRVFLVPIKSKRRMIVTQGTK